MSCGGVSVEPGDAILADENGVLVLKPGDIVEASSRAVEDAYGRRKRPSARVAKGEKTASDINGANARIAEIMRAAKA